MTHHRHGLGWLVLAAVCWGTSGTLGVLLQALSGLGSLAIGGYRITVGGALILMFALLTGRLRVPRSRRGWARVAALGAASGIFQMAFFSAIESVGVSVATMITIGSSPAMVAAVEAFTGRQRLTVRLGIALGAALVGLALLAGARPADLTVDAALIGAALALIAGACFAGISLLGANPDPDFDDATGTALAFLAGGAAVLAIASRVGPVTFVPTPGSVALVVALGLIPSAVAYLSYLRGLRTQTGTVGAMVSLLEPLTAALVALVVLGTVLTPLAAVGAVLLTGSVLLTATAPSADHPGQDRMEPELHP